MCALLTLRGASGQIAIEMITIRIRNGAGEGLWRGGPMRGAAPTCKK